MTSDISGVSGINEISKICDICTDPYNKVRAPVECPRCHASACTRCVKTYLLSNTIEPKCMGCSSAWDMEFVRKNLSKSFLDSEYKKHQISALLSQAEASLGEIQRWVPVRTRIDALTEEIRTEKERIDTLHKELGSLCSHNLLERKTAEWRETQQFLTIHWNEKSRLMQHWELGQLPDNVDPGAAIATPKDGRPDRAEFFMACPRKECRGRVSSAYKCGLCEHWACPDCHADKGLEHNGPHECRDEDKETVRMLRQNTKNCPECHEGIFKEYGCDQMWCTRCRTCFSWKTGKKLSGAIHNPHYYEYMFRDRGAGAAPPDPPLDANACHGFPRYDNLVWKWSQHDSGIGEEDRPFLNNTHRLTNHLRYVEIPRLRTTVDEEDMINTVNSRKWGVEYLRNHVTREEWGQKLYLAYRKKERGQRRMNILEMFVMVSCDLYRNWYQNAMSGPDLVESVYKLIEYANENIRLHNQQYGTKVALLDPNASQPQHIIEYQP